MSSIITAAQRRRLYLLASSFLVPIVSLGISSAQAQQALAEHCRRSRSSRPPTRTGPAPSRPMRKHRPRAASCLRLRRRPARDLRREPARTSLRRVPRKVRADRRRQFSGIVGASATVITAEEIAHSPSQTLQEIIAQMPGVQLAILFGGVNGAKTRSTSAASARSPPPIPWSSSTAAGSTTSTWPAWISRPFRSIRSSASKSRAATAARCSTATTRSAASSTSS